MAWACSSPGRCKLKFEAWAARARSHLALYMWALYMWHLYLLKRLAIVINAIDRENQHASSTYKQTMPQNSLITQNNTMLVEKKLK